VDNPEHTGRRPEKNENFHHDTTCWMVTPIDMEAGFTERVLLRSVE